MGEGEGGSGGEDDGSDVSLLFAIVGIAKGLSARVLDFELSTRSWILSAYYVSRVRSRPTCTVC